MTTKTQVKLYLENSSLKMVDELIKRRFLGSNRGEVMRNIIQQYLVQNAANIKAMSGMVFGSEDGPLAED